MITRLNPATVHPPAGLYSHGILAPAAGHWLHLAGQVGVRPDGSLAAGIEAQSQAAWTNIVALLAAAEMTLAHVVKITTYLLDAEDLKAFAAVRAGFLGDARPASTLVIVKALARPEWRVEVEAVACKA